MPPGQIVVDVLSRDGRFSVDAKSRADSRVEVAFLTCPDGCGLAASSGLTSPAVESALPACAVDELARVLRFLAGTKARDRNDARRVVCGSSRLTVSLGVWPTRSQGRNLLRYRVGTGVLTCSRMQCTSGRMVTLQANVAGVLKLTGSTRAATWSQSAPKQCRTRLPRPSTHEFMS